MEHRYTMRILCENVRKLENTYPKQLMVGKFPHVKKKKYDPRNLNGNCVLKHVNLKCVWRRQKDKDG